MTTLTSKPRAGGGWNVTAIAVACCGFVGLYGCRSIRSTVQAGSSGTYAGSNVILIELNPLRRDRVGVYGSTRGLTPVLDAFARRAIRFDQAIAVAPWCVPGKLAMWTGLYPTAHGMHNRFMTSATGETVSAALSSKIPTYPEALKAAGYAVVGFTGDAGVTGSFGFNRGFDRYVDDREFGGFDYTVPLAIEWLKTHQGQRFFLWLNGYDAHWGYRPSSGYQRRFAPTYGGPLAGTGEEQKRFQEQSLQMRFAMDKPVKDMGWSVEDRAFYEALYEERVQAGDARLGIFFRTLEELGLMKNTMIVVFSGGGDEYFDHGFLGHGATLYDEVLHVPLFVKFPGQDTERVIPDQVRLFDVFPTLFDFLKLSFHHPVDGVSLRPLLNGESMQLPAMAETRFRSFTHQYALRSADGHYKFIYTEAPAKRVELYDLSHDPHEQRNIAPQQPRIAYDLEQALFTIVRQAQIHAKAFGISTLDEQEPRHQL